MPVRFYRLAPILFLLLFVMPTFAACGSDDPSAGSGQADDDSAAPTDDDGFGNTNGEAAEAVVLER